jgi:fatty acid desaturase
VSPAKVETDSKIFAYSRYDIVPVLAAVSHFVYLIFLFLAFTRLHLAWHWLIPLGLIYSVSISWNINGISHNFLHNPYFRSHSLNRIFSFMESLACGFSQVFYTNVHKWHHVGNGDLPDEHGNTHDPLSIYKHGKDGKAENGWTYVFCSYFRDDPKKIFNDIHRLNPAEAWWGVAEIAAFVLFFATGFVLSWKFMCFFLPFYYFGHCLSYLNGYYLHLGGNPLVPMAWGVSSYEKLYNWLWFNNGYHAEHHYRPRLHWTLMNKFHTEIADKQKEAGTRVIWPPHALGFLDGELRRDLGSHRATSVPTTTPESASV